MKVCFFGIYDPTYARNRVLISGLEQSGFEIVECRVDPRQNKGFKKYIELFKLARKVDTKSVDAVIVGFPGHTVVWLAYLLFGKKIIFDAFLSLYDSNVFDRKLYSQASPKAWRDWIYDWYSTHLASRILVDTNQHIEYFHTTFGIKNEKQIRVLIGADSSVFFPRPRTKTDEFIVHFHGNFIPLQGLEYIIDAALRLEDEGVIVQIVGDGQEGKKIRAQVAASGKGKNIRFIGKVPVTDVPSYIAGSDITLGIFGNTEKTQRVIPNKVYECLAMARPVITAATPAISEVFTEKELLATNVADGKDLAEKILFLKNNPEKREVLAQEGYNYFVQKLNPQKIVQPLVEYIHTH